MSSTHLLRPSVSWRNARLYRGMVKRAHLAAYASRDETSPGPHYGLWTVQMQRQCQSHGVMMDVLYSNHWRDVAATLKIALVSLFY